MEGIPDNNTEVGTNLSYSCTKNRIKPKAAEMYWMVNGRRENGTLASVITMMMHRNGFTS